MSQTVSNLLVNNFGIMDCDSAVLSVVGGRLKGVKDSINRWFPYEPFLLIGGTALVVHGIHRFMQRVPKDGALEGIKREFFRNVKKIPYVKKQIDDEITKTKKTLEDEMSALYRGDKEQAVFITKIPNDGLDTNDILSKVTEYLELGTYSWTDGAVSGTVYHGGKELTDLNAKVYEMSTWTNPLHPDVFPGVCKMESEIVRISAELFHGNCKTVGTMTSGGTESIMLAVKAYRDIAVKEKGVLHPEILVPVTAHAAFDKAAQLLNIGIKHVPVIPETCTVDLKAMRRMITKNTIMLCGSAPAFPQGCIDPIEAIAELGRKYKIPVHVDACLGGFLLAFMPAAGFTVPNFDFKVCGVTSISADTHKYGFAPKGSSVLMFSDLKYKHHQYFLQPDWPGGLYASPTLAGSRPGALIAGCWATMLYFGMAGYTETTRKIITTARFIESKLRKINGIYIMGNPQVSVLAFASKDFDIYRLQEALKDKGWSLNALQFPPSIHFCLTYCQTEPGVAERFVMDVQHAVAEIMKDPKAPSTGAAAIYGTSQTVPDRSIIGEITAIFMDTLYETNFQPCDTAALPAANGKQQSHKSPKKPVKKQKMPQ